MRPQDILVLLKIVSHGESAWRQLDLANWLKISPSEIAESLERSRVAKLIDNKKKKPFRKNLLEFLVYGLRYVFPVQPGPETRGVPTSHSSPFMKNKIISDQVYVWPSSKGKVRGASIEPLFKSVPYIVEDDSNLYEMLSYLDAIRIGKPREMKVAIEKLNKIILD